MYIHKVLFFFQILILWCFIFSKNKFFGMLIKTNTVHQVVICILLPCRFPSFSIVFVFSFFLVWWFWFRNGFMKNIFRLMIRLIFYFKNVCMPLRWLKKLTCVKKISRISGDVLICIENEALYESTAYYQRFIRSSTATLEPKNIDPFSIFNVFI